MILFVRFDVLCHTIFIGTIKVIRWWNCNEYNATSRPFLIHFERVCEIEFILQLLLKIVNNSSSQYLCGGNFIKNTDIKVTQIILAGGKIIIEWWATKFFQLGHNVPWLRGIRIDFVLPAIFPSCYPEWNTCLNGKNNHGSDPYITPYSHRFPTERRIKNATSIDHASTRSYTLYRFCGSCNDGGMHYGDRAQPQMNAVFVFINRIRSPELIISPRLLYNYPALFRRLRTRRSFFFSLVHLLSFASPFRFERFPPARTSHLIFNMHSWMDAFFSKVNEICNWWSVIVVRRRL